MADDKDFTIRASNSQATTFRAWTAVSVFQLNLFLVFVTSLIIGLIGYRAADVYTTRYEACESELRVLENITQFEEIEHSSIRSDDLLLCRGTQFYSAAAYTEINLDDEIWNVQPYTSVRNHVHNGSLIPKWALDEPLALPFFYALAAPRTTNLMGSQSMIEPSYSLCNSKLQAVLSRIDALVELGKQAGVVASSNITELMDRTAIYKPDAGETASSYITQCPSCSKRPEDLSFEAVETLQINLESAMTTLAAATSTPVSQKRYLYAAAGMVSAITTAKLASITGINYKQYFPTCNRNTNGILGYCRPSDYLTVWPTVDSGTFDTLVYEKHDPLLYAVVQQLTTWLPAVFHFDWPVDPALGMSYGVGSNNYQWSDLKLETGLWPLFNALPLNSTQLSPVYGGEKMCHVECGDEGATCATTDTAYWRSPASPVSGAPAWTTAAGCGVTYTDIASSVTVDLTAYSNSEDAYMYVVAFENSQLEAKAEYAISKGWLQCCTGDN